MLVYCCILQHSFWMILLIMTFIGAGCTHYQIWRIIRINNLYYVCRPITHIAETFFPPQYTQNSAGSITGITTLILAVTYKFLDICTHLSIGAIIGKFSINKKVANLSPMLKIGIVLLTIGFFIAPIIQSAYPTIPMFWLGFFLVVRSKQIANPENYWAKGAMWGLLGYVLAFIKLKNLYYVYSPISHIAATFFPPQYTQNSAGSITGITTLILAGTYKFLDICTYISIGAIIGKLSIKKIGAIIGKLSINKKVANLSPMLIIGIVLLTIGFFIAPIKQNASHSTTIFLLGFFLVLRSKQIANPENYWAKGAMWGLLVSVLLYITTFILENLEYSHLYITPLPDLAYIRINNLYYVCRPITHIAETFFPPQYTQNSAGSITGITTYKFLDICTHISIVAILGKLYIKKIGKLPINKKVANLSPMLKIGIVLLTIGFFIAPIIQSAYPTIPMFWLGFFLVVRSKQIANPANYWAKGAMWGLLGYVLAFITINNLYYVYSPISHIAETFFPPQYTQNSAGSITGITTLILAGTYKFLDICTYISIGAILGKLYKKIS